AATILLGIAAGVVVQIARGWWHFDPLVYLSLFWLIGAPLALYAAAAVLIHALSPGKYAGLVLVVLFIIGAQRAAGFGPAVTYSALFGFSDSLVRFSMTMLVWSAIAAGCLAFAATTWRRLRDRARDRLRPIAFA